MSDDFLIATFPYENNISLKLPKNKISDDFITRPHWHETEFRKINTFLMERGIIPKNKNIIDSGAYIGDNALPWAKMVQENNGKVYAIDPCTENCVYIDSVARCNALDNIQTFVYALSSKDDEVLSTNSLLDHCSFVFDNPGENGWNKVHSVCLDTMVRRGEIENVGYIHLDVEGMEYRVICGASQLIETERPIITYEQHIKKEDTQIVLSFLSERNYIVYLVDAVMKGCWEDCRNLIAFPMEVFSETLIQEINQHIGRDILIPMKTSL